MLAGLGGQDYSPQSFRPTGASVAIKADTKPETGVEIGHWKSDQVFSSQIHKCLH